MTRRPPSVLMLAVGLAVGLAMAGVLSIPEWTAQAASSEPWTCWGEMARPAAPAYWLLAGELRVNPVSRGDSETRSDMRGPAPSTAKILSNQPSPIRDAEHGREP